MAEREVNLLFTSVNWRVGLIRAFREALDRVPGVRGKVVTLELDPLSSARFAGDANYLVPPMAAPEFPDRLLEICKAESITAVFPITNNDLRVLKTLRPMLQDAGVRLVMSPDRAIEICEDKYEVYHFLSGINIPTPRTYVVDEAFDPQPDEFPFLLKSRKGEGSAFVAGINTLEELNLIATRTGRAVAQDMLKGTEYTIDLLFDLEGTPLAAVPRERIDIRAGEVFKARTVVKPDIVETCLVIGKALGVVGPVTFQCFETEHGNVFTDLNLRFGSGVLLSIAAGADYPEKLVRMLAGETVEPFFDTYTPNQFMLRYLEAVFKRDLDISKRRPNPSIIDTGEKLGDRVK